MSKNDTPAAKEPAVVVDELTLSEFCSRLSESVRRPELIAGFEYSERQAGKLKDRAEAFQARFDNFIKSPV
jgi:hypothetical protein